MRGIEVDTRWPTTYTRWGGLFCHKNQSCSKLPETDKSVVKKFSLILGGGFSATKTKVARNCLKRINLWSKNFPSSWGGSFSVTKTKVARNCLKRINLWSKNFPSSWGGGGGLFCHQKPKWGSMMHERSVREVTSCAVIRAEYLTKRQKRGGGFSADLHLVEVLPVEYSSLS